MRALRRSQFVHLSNVGAIEPCAVVVPQFPDSQARPHLLRLKRRSCVLGFRLMSAAHCSAAFRQTSSMSRLFSAFRLPSRSASIASWVLATGVVGAWYVYDERKKKLARPMSDGEVRLFDDPGKLC